MWVKLPRGVKIKAISAGYDSALALTSTGRVLSWGGNEAGELGDGTGVERHVPGYVSLPKHTRITSLAAGDDTGFAVTSAGRLLAWGYNGFGELGDGTTTSRETPVLRPPARRGQGHRRGGGPAPRTGPDPRSQGPGLGRQHPRAARHRFRHQPPHSRPDRAPRRDEGHRAGRRPDFSLVLTAGHHILAWGGNGEGQLGNGTTTDQPLPVRVHLPRGFTPAVIGAGWRADDALAAGRQAPK